MDRLRSPAIQQVIEALEARRSRPRDALQVVELGDTPQFRHDCIVRRPVRHARAGGRQGDVDVIGGERLLLSRLARCKLGTHAHFRSPVTCIPRGKHKFTRDISDGYI